MAPKDMEGTRTQTALRYDGTRTQMAPKDMDYTRTQTALRYGGTGTQMAYKDMDDTRTQTALGHRWHLHLRAWIYLGHRHHYDTDVT